MCIDSVRVLKELATSKTWTQPLDRTLKNLDPAKSGL